MGGRLCKAGAWPTKRSTHWPLGRIVHGNKEKGSMKDDDLDSQIQECGHLLICLLKACCHSEESTCPGKSTSLLEYCGMLRCLPLLARWKSQQTALLVIFRFHLMPHAPRVPESWGCSCSGLLLNASDWSQKTDNTHVHDSATFAKVFMDKLCSENSSRLMR